MRNFKTSILLLSLHMLFFIYTKG